MTAIECLKCEWHEERENDKEFDYCNFYEDCINKNYDGFCNCGNYWDNRLDWMTKEELISYIEELGKLILKQNKCIRKLHQSVMSTEKSREYWVKKYCDLCDEIIEKKE